MSEVDYNLQNILTNLAVRVGQFEGTIETFMKQWRDQDTAANLGRQVLRERIELLSMQVERLANDLQSVQQDVAELKNEIDDDVMPKVRADELIRARNAGARGVLVMLWGGVVVIVSAMAYIADRVVAWYTHKP